MTLDQLETFLAIANEGGLRAASKVLHKTQPTLSTSMKNLEDELGLTLLDRESYRVKLTDEGNALFEKAQDILSQVQQFQTLAKELSMGREAKLSLAIDYLCPVEFLLKVLNKFRKSCHHTKLEMDFEVLGGAEDKLLNNNANIAITPFISKHSRVESQKICDIKIIPVASTQIFKTSKPQLPLFLETPQIIVKDSAKKSLSLDFGQNQDSRGWTVSDHMIKKELILNGFGWGHLEASSIEKEIKAKKLIELKLNGVKAKTLPLYIVRANNKPFGPAANDLWNHMVEQFKEI